jgi:hypothetical protein
MEFAKFAHRIAINAQIINARSAKMVILLLLLDHVLFAPITVYSVLEPHHRALHACLDFI